MTTANVPPDGKDYWNDEDPDNPHEDWVYAVDSGDTRMGYWEWVESIHQMEELPSQAEE